MRNITFVDRAEISGVTTITSANLHLYDVDDDGVRLIKEVCLRSSRISSLLSVIGT